MSPLKPFQFAQLPAFHYGAACRHQLCQHLASQGHQRVLIISSASLTQPGGWAQDLVAQLTAHQIKATLIPVSGEPSPDQVDQMVAQHQANDHQAVVGIGGGSALDSAKAVAGLIPSGRSVMDFLEGVGQGKPFDEPTLPWVAVPTTAGTGSETTKNAVLARQGAFKKSFRSERLLAQSVWLDPELLQTCPDSVLYATAMDALTQLIESYVTPKATPMTDALAWQGLSLCREAFAALPTTDNDTTTNRPSLAVLERWLLAASLSGVTLANAGLGAVHGLAGPIGAFFPAPHGAVCARLLAPITAENIHALEQGQTEGTLNPAQGQSLEKYTQIAQAWQGNIDPTSTLSDPAQVRAQWVSQLQHLTARWVPQGLSHHGLSEDNLSPVLKNCRSGSMLGNPLELSDAALMRAMTQAL